jgi:glycosyltransferase involved in cell wall biosynthesis
VEQTKLRVAFDATPLLGTRTGVGEVTLHMLRSLAERSDLAISAYAITLRRRNELERALPAGVTPATSAIPARATRALWPRLAAPAIERWTGAVDVVHAAAFVAPPSAVPVLLTIHDLTFHNFPEMCTPDTLSYDGLVRIALERGATVHTYSDFVADEVRAAFGLPADRVIRVYPGLAETGGGDPARGRELAGSARYVLALSTIEPRKNLPTLVRAFDAVAANDPELLLVIGGPDGWGVEAFDAACASARNGARVRRLGYIGERERRDLLAGATVLAYPSLYEGFGHPPLEAMRAGVPVVASKGGALPEVLGDAALLPDPSDVDAVAADLERAVTDDALRAQLRELGAQRAARYTWSRAAAEVADLYRRLDTEHRGAA